MKVLGFLGRDNARCLLFAFHHTCMPFGGPRAPLIIAPRHFWEVVWRSEHPSESSFCLRSGLGSELWTEMLHLSGFNLNRASRSVPLKWSFWRDSSPEQCPGQLLRTVRIFRNLGIPMWRRPCDRGAMSRSDTRWGLEPLETLSSGHGSSFMENVLDSVDFVWQVIRGQSKGPKRRGVHVSRLQNCLHEQILPTFRLRLLRSSDRSSCGSLIIWAPRCQQVVAGVARVLLRLPSHPLRGSHEAHRRRQGQSVQHAACNSVRCISWLSPQHLG